MTAEETPAAKTQDSRTSTEGVVMEDHWDEHRETQVGHVPDLAMTYASVKYWSREERGPRTPDGTLTLDELAAALVNVLEESWRQGHRSDTLTKAATALIRERKRRA